MADVTQVQVQHGTEDDSTIDLLQEKHERVHPWTWRFFGLYYQYFAMGFFYGSMSPMMYPIFNHVLEMPSYRTKGALQVITMWWTFKMFIGALSDSFPIFGYRRKPYIIGGWFAAVILTVVLITFGQPAQGGDPIPYIIMLSALTLVYLVGDVAMDSYLVDCAQREPVEVRGTLQSSIYVVRFSTMTLVSGLMAFGFSSKEYGGDFNWGFKLPEYLAILATVATLGLYPYWRLEEFPTAERKSYLGEFKKLLKRIELDAVWRVIAFSFLVHFFAYFSNANAYDIERQWCHAQPWVDGLLGHVFSNLAVTVGIWYTKKYLLNVSWRKILAVTIVLMAILTYIPALLVDFAVIRSQFFYLGAPLANQLVYGIFFIVCTFCAVEIAEKGSEGIMYGLITTVGNLSIPFTSVCSNIIASWFHVYTPDHKTLLDTPEARKEMAKLDTVIFILQLLALPMILLLPPQKEAIKRLIDADLRHQRLSRCILVGLAICFVWSCTANILLIFPSTACNRMVGGRGC